MVRIPRSLASPANASIVLEVSANDGTAGHTANFQACDSVITAVASFNVDGPNASPSCRTELNNLIDPAFAWHYYLAGDSDSTYLAPGDEMFSHALDADIGFNDKIFSQNYRWSFDYVFWRSSP